MTTVPATPELRAAAADLAAARAQLHQADPATAAPAYLAYLNEEYATCERQLSALIDDALHQPALNNPPGPQHGNRLSAGPTDPANLPARVHAMRRFYACATANGLNTRAAILMRAALAEALGQPVVSRADLSARDWDIASDLLARHLLRW